MWQFFIRTNIFFIQINARCSDVLKSCGAGAEMGDRGAANTASSQGYQGYPQGYQGMDPSLRPNLNHFSGSPSKNTADPNGE